jgi:small-conductance mechanosensitive channel
MEAVLSALGANNAVLMTLYKTVLILMAAVLLWVIIRRVLKSIQNRTAHKAFFQANDQFFPFVQRALLYLLTLLVGTYLIRLLQLQVIVKVFPALLIVLLANPLKDLILIFLKLLEENLADKTETKIDDIVFDLANKFAGVAIYAVAVVVALDILGINVMPFIAGAGVAGIAIGFAAKDTLSNLIAGVLLIVDRPFEIGDRIEVWSAPAGSASWGDVIDIGLRATKIRTTDNLVIIIPNNEIMKRDIVNYTLSNTRIRVRINIGISYEADLAQAKAIVLEVARQADWISSTPPPKVVVRNFGDSAVDLQARVWIEDARRRMDTISFITDKVKEAFDREGIEIPYPKRDITVVHRAPAAEPAASPPQDAFEAPPARPMTATDTKE